MKGKLIVIEGTDCSGKETQTKSLVKRLEKDNIPCNIIADKDGIIEKISVRQGMKKVDVGDSVCKGDIFLCPTHRFYGTPRLPKHGPRACPSVTALSAL